MTDVTDGIAFAHNLARMQSIVRQRKTPQTHLPRTRRVIGRFVGDSDGPTLVAVGSIHGNEPGGRIALERVAEFLRSSRIVIRGRVYLVNGNIQASAKKVRFIDGDLNRRWTREQIVRNTPSPHTSFTYVEDQEQHELLKIFREVLGSAADEVYVLDLHSTSANGLPFATVGDTMRNRRFAMSLPVTILLGIEEQLEGTMLEFLNNEGAVTLGFEGGQHEAESTVEKHEALVLAALVSTGILRAADVPRYREHIDSLYSAGRGAGIIEVRHREPVSPGDEFVMEPGFRNFDRVEKGQVLARNKFGQIRAPESGMILMPLYQKLGEDGFFIARSVAPFWLKVSAFLRRLDAARFVRFLPGVRAFPKRPEQLQIDTRIARFFPLQIFHLLGFRRLRLKRNFLLVSRRRFDTTSPFKKWRA